MPLFVNARHRRSQADEVMPGLCTAQLAEPRTPAEHAQFVENSLADSQVHEGAHRPCFVACDRRAVIIHDDKSVIAHELSIEAYGNLGPRIHIDKQKSSV